jgi:hypothetical protein
MENQTQGESPLSATPCSPLGVIRWGVSFLLTIPLGILWGLAFIPAFPLSAAFRLDMDKSADDMEKYWETLGRLLRAIRGANKH